MPDSPPVVIIGAGLAGLACAKTLHDRGAAVRVFEAEPEVGGRVRTEAVPGPAGTHLVDRGFQIYLDSYPVGKAMFDHDRLHLGSFRAGAWVRCQGSFWRLADPLAHPLTALTDLARFPPLLTVMDLPRLIAMDAPIRASREDNAWSTDNITTAEFLASRGLSDRIIERFFRPFFGGVFLDRSLRVSARKFRWLYRMFGSGRATLPREGIAALPAQLARSLPAGAVSCAAPVESIEAGGVTLVSGEFVKASSVVVATDARAASRLGAIDSEPAFASTITVAFAGSIEDAGEPTRRMLRDPMLMLDGEGDGPANHVAVVSAAQPTYAPQGWFTLYANIVAPHAANFADTEPEGPVRAQLRAWFGSCVDGWTHLRTVRVPCALPADTPERLEQPRRPVESAIPGVYLAGDHTTNASINGALESGIRAAEAALNTPAPA